MNVKIYEKEIADGIGELVKSNSSVAYLATAKPLNVIDEKLKDRIQKSVAASNPNQSDLFYLDTILATSCCNLNFDIFTKAEMWAARHTAEDKPFNLGHVETDIIGHMTSNFVVDDEFKLIADNASLDEVPDKIHILTSAVIYRFWSDNDRRAAIAKIIEEIDKGEWFVSMECLFSDFDYGLISTAGEQRIIARTDESSFLTKHLRQYGGTGVYNNYQVARVLKNIKFVGKGLVSNPANPESVILTDIPPFKTVTASLGYIQSSEFQDKNGESNMTDEVKATFEKEIKELKAQLSEANLKQYTDKIDKLEAELVSAKDAVVQAEKVAKDKTEEAKSALDQLTKDKEAAEAEVVKFKKLADEATAEVSKVNKEKRTQARVAAAKDKNASDEDAKSFAEKHADKSDEDFNEVLSYATYKWVVKEDAPKPVTAAKILDDATPPAADPVFVPDANTSFVEIQEALKAAFNSKKDKEVK